MKPPAGPRKRYASLAAGFAAIGGLLFGYNVGVISGAILFIREDFHLSTLLVETVVSATSLGGLIGAAAGGALADRFGRRRVLLLTALVFIAGAIFSATAGGVSWLILALVIVGFAVGLDSFASPLYISEISSSDLRGRRVALNQIAMTVGIVLAFLADYGLSGIHGWRWMFALSAVPALIFLVGMSFMPESPRWLMQHGQADKARDALRGIREESEVEPELANIAGTLEAGQEDWTDIFAPSCRPALVIGILLAVFQQLTGINTVIYYAPMIFQYAGFRSPSTAILATLVIGVTNVIMTVVARSLLDRVGRRPLLLTSLAGMVAGLAVLGAAFSIPALTSSLGWVALASLVLYVGAFALGLGPVFWLLIAEIYPLRVRGVAMGAATFVNWGANLLMAMSFLTMVQHLGRSWTFWSYGVIGIAAWIFAYFRVPETKGKSLEEIEAQWRGGVQPRTTGEPK